MIRILGLVLFILIGFGNLGFSKEPIPSQKEISYYLVGNSLTWDTVPSKLDGDTQWHVDCGKSLPYIFENPGKPCVKTSTLWPKALKEKQYDVISLQCHYGSTLEEDAVVISQFMELQPKATIIIHTGWARWAEREEEWADESAEGKLTHSIAYFDALLKTLKKNYPDREIRRTRAMDCLNKITEDIKNENAPIKDVQELYRDKVHMNIVTGRYLMHNAMRVALGQKRSAVGFDKISPDLKRYLDRVLDEVVGGEG